MKIYSFYLLHFKQGCGTMRSVNILKALREAVFV